MKEPDYAMKIVASWMKIYKLEGTKTRIDFIYSSGKKETKQFSYRQTFGIHFRYIYHVYNHNNRRHMPIFLERTRATKLWPDRNFAWYLAVSEVNTALVSGHFQSYGVVQPSLYFSKNTIGVELRDSL